MELRNEYSKWLGFANQLVDRDDPFPLPINQSIERSSWPQARQNRLVARTSASSPRSHWLLSMHTTIAKLSGLLFHDARAVPAATVRRPNNVWLVTRKSLKKAFWLRQFRLYTKHLYVIAVSVVRKDSSAKGIWQVQKEVNREREAHKSKTKRKINLTSRALGPRGSPGMRLMSFLERKHRGQRPPAASSALSRTTVISVSGSGVPKHPQLMSICSR